MNPDRSSFKVERLLLACSAFYQAMEDTSTADSAGIVVDIWQALSIQCLTINVDVDPKVIVHVDMDCFYCAVEVSGWSKTVFAVWCSHVHALTIP